MRWGGGGRVQVGQGGERVGGSCAWAGGLCALRLTLVPPLLGHLLLDVEQELVVREGRLRAVLHQVLEEAGLRRGVVPDTETHGACLYKESCRQLSETDPAKDTGEFESLIQEYQWEFSSAWELHNLPKFFK